MSICARIIIAVSFQKVDYAPDTQTGTEGNYQRLQHIDCTVEKLHTKTRSYAAREAQTASPAPASFHLK